MKCNLLNKKMKTCLRQTCLLEITTMLLIVLADWINIQRALLFFLFFQQSIT